MSDKRVPAVQPHHSGPGCNVGCDSGSIFSYLQHLSIFDCQCQCIRQRGVMCLHQFCTDVSEIKVLCASALADFYAMALERSCCPLLLSHVAVARIDSK